MREPLPIDAVLPAVLAALERSPSVVLQAPTGAGKTTRVPPALLDAGVPGRIVMLEPRRLAARAAARRMAAERGEEVGRTVGYQVRFDRRASEETRILVVTEGLLVRMLQDDPFLEGVGAVVLDELHERSLDADLALAMLRRVQAEARPDLKLVAMSATLEADPLAAFLGAERVSSEGRLFPVDVEHLPRPDPRPVEEVAGEAVQRLLSEGARGVLVFLPGMAEIRRTERALGGLDAEVHVLHGDLPAERQDAALRPSSRRKVVLATNVAQTSVTVAGIEAVVDSGLHRQLRFDPGTGLDRLETVAIARDAAAQRAGRAGREGPGRCLRLWTARAEQALADREVPEIRRVDLAGPVLQLLAWGEPDPAAFPWFEAPAPDALTAAVEALTRLGAVREGRITPIGTTLARLPLHPRLGRLVVDGHRLGVGKLAVRAAALLSERDPFGREEPVVRSPSDLLDRVEVLEAIDAGRPTRRTASPGGARHVLRVAEQIERMARRALGPEPAAADPVEGLGRAVLAAWPDRVCRRRGADDARARMVGGRGVVLARESAVLEPALFVAVDLQDRPGEALVRLASGVRREWLELERGVEVRFDAAAERVAAVEQLRYGDLVLEEHAAPLPDDEAVAAALIEAARRDPPGALGLDRPEIASFLARVRFLREAMPELELPEPDPAAVLSALCAGRRSFAQLREGALDALKATLGWRGLQALEAQAPERIEVPTGSRIRLRWEEGGPPVLPVKMQELFGLTETPRVAAGRVPVVLHLLAPNGRPQQVTDDLAGFWERTWPEVRKELRARYPRHAWPEDPRTARPQRR